MKKNKMKYNIGLDIGTSSVGWAVTDNNYKLLKKGNKNLWGTRLFDSAESAKDRRMSRSTRRRYNKRRERIRLLREVMSDMVLKMDESFFHRLDSTTFLDEEDKSIRLGKLYKNNYNIFVGDDYNDKDFYNNYKTIYHLRYDLATKKEKADPRLIYLALHHIVKYRGNFLYEGQTFDLESNNILEDLQCLFNDICLINNMNMIIERKCIDVLEVLKKNTSRKQIVNDCIQCIDDNTNKTVWIQVLNGLLGMKCNFTKIIQNELLQINDKNIEINFSSEKFEEVYEVVENELDHTYIEVINRMKKIYSWITLNNITEISNPIAPISSSMIKRYESHKKDLRLLKDVIKDLKKSEYNEIFKNKTPGKNNYYCYIHHPKDTTREKFYNYLENKLKGLDDNRVSEILDKIEADNFLLKQNSLSNGEIPYQLNYVEMKAIIDNQSKYYPELLEKDLTKILTFRIPYYYGPLDGNKEYGWLIKRESEQNTRITPWNHMDVVDIDKTAEKFIRKLTNYCTYLPNEKVMPKNSLTCSMYEVLSELNKIKVNGRNICVSTKKDIIENIFKKHKTVKESHLKDWYKKNLIELNNENLEFKGFQKEGQFSSSLKPWIDFTNVFGEINDDNYELIESIIYDMTIFEDKSILKRRLESIYKLSKDKINKILKLSYKGWSRLSKELIIGIKCDNRIGSCSSILDVMEETNYALMEIINNKELGYKQEIEKYNYEEKEGKFKYEDVDELAGSPALKKGIWQSLKIVEEIVSYMGSKPSNVFIEFTRNEQEKKRSVTQVKKLKDIYKDITLQNDDFIKVNEELLKYDDKTRLDNERLYLYFTQMGQSMYSDTSLDIDKLSMYQIDHILPQSLIKDDSLDNKVLVLVGENQRKLDDLVLPKDIRSKMISKWEYLHERKLISDKKFYNLIRAEFREEQKERFINRQIVETSQIIKNVANIINNYYTETNVVTIRASLSHDFRTKFDLYKIRDYNSYHHAHDAYIACILGEYLNNRYPNMNAAFVYGQYIKQAKDKKSLHEKHGFILNSMDYDAYNKETGEVIWLKDNIKDILKCFDYKDCFVTKKLEEKEGAFYDATIHANEMNRGISKNNKIPSFPINEDRSDMKKYGGFSGVKSIMYAIEGIKGDRRGTSVRKVTKVPLIYKNKDIDFKLDYIKENEKLREVRIIKEIKVNQLIEIDGGLYFITSSSELVNANQLLLSKALYKILSSIDKAIKFNDYTNLSEDKVIKLYIELINKLRDYYPKYLSLADKFESLLDKFKSLNIQDKCKVINQMIVITSPSATNGNIKLDNFKLPDRLGRLSGQTINLDNAFFIYQSITGIYSKKEKL